MLFNKKEQPKHEPSTEVKPTSITTKEKPVKEAPKKMIFCVKEVSVGEWSVFSKTVSFEHALAEGEYKTVTDARKIAVAHAENRISHLRQTIKNLRLLRVPTVPALEPKSQ